MNIWAYNSNDFGSTNAPFCADGNSDTDTVNLRSGEYRWDRTVGFTDLENLIDILPEHLGDTTTSGQNSSTMTRLAVQCHGLPGQLLIMPNAGLLHSSNVAFHTDKLVALNRILHAAGNQVMVLFMSCTAAAAPYGTDLFQTISSFMSDTRIIGFRTILTTDGIRPRELPNNRICLPPDMRVTSEQATTANIHNPGGSWTSADIQNMPAASQRSAHAREFLNGQLVWEAPEDTRATHNGYFRPRQGYQGRARGGAPVIHA